MSTVRNLRLGYFFKRHPARLGLIFTMCMLCAAWYVLIHRHKSQGRVGGSMWTRFTSRRPNLLKCPERANVVSLANPPFYPKHGTGIIRNVPAEFDTSKLNSFCDTSPPLTAILPVYSAVEHFEIRTAMRDTIGRECQKLNCKVMFIVGFSPNVLLMQRLKIEYDNCMDILIIDRVDTYRDLNNKAVAMLDWLLEFCSEPPYVIHLVDDTYVNVGMFIEDLKNVGSAIYGFVVMNIPTIRDKRNKFYVSFEEYPYETLPNFIGGNAYGFPNSITKDLRCAVSNAIYIWVEDQWLTGHVRELAGIQYAFTERKVEIFGRTIPQRELSFEDANDFLFIHSIVSEDFYRLYYHMLDQKRRLNT